MKGCEIIKKKYFVISDIHSHYYSMIQALENSNYNSDNPEHYLIVLGDLFDRGENAVEVLEYLYKLEKESKATIILGNHDTFLLDFLEGQHSKAFFNIHFNSFGKTLFQLSGIETKEDNLGEIQKVIETKYPYLKEWIRNFPLYIEIGDYIFVHGGIDGANENWRTESTRHDFVWSREINLPRVPGKTVVVGHHRVATIRKPSKDYNLLFQKSPEMFDILYEDGKILLDRFVEVSKEINVLTLELEGLI